MFERFMAWATLACPMASGRQTDNASRESLESLFSLERVGGMGEKRERDRDRERDGKGVKEGAGSCLSRKRVHREREKEERMETSLPLWEVKDWEWVELVS